MDRIIDYAFVAKEWMITYLIIKPYFNLTAYLPRRLPTSKQEFHDLLFILKAAYGLEINEAVVITVAGQITSTQANSLRKSYGSIANAAKRLSINAIAQAERSIAMRMIEDKLNIAAEKASNELKASEPNPEESSPSPGLPNGAYHNEGDVQSVQST